MYMYFNKGSKNNPFTLRLIHLSQFMCSFIGFISFQNPGYMKDNFHITIETLHAPGTGELTNVSCRTAMDIHCRTQSLSNRYIACIICLLTGLLHVLDASLFPSEWRLACIICLFSPNRSIARIRWLDDCSPYELLPASSVDTFLRTDDSHVLYAVLSFLSH